MINTDVAPLPFQRTNPISTERCCCICRENFSLGERVTHHIGNGDRHPFHIDCIRRIRDANCPECRAPIDLRSLDTLETSSEMRARKIHFIKGQALCFGFALAFTEMVWRLDILLRDCRNMGPLSFREHYLLQLYHDAEILRVFSLVYSISRLPRLFILASLFEISAPTEGRHNHYGELRVALENQVIQRIRLSDLEKIILERIIAAPDLFQAAFSIWPVLLRASASLTPLEQRIVRVTGAVFSAAVWVQRNLPWDQCKTLYQGAKELLARLQQPKDLLNAPIQTKVSVMLHYVSIIAEPIIKTTIHPFSLKGKIDSYLNKLGFDDVVIYGITRTQIAAVIANIAREAIEQATLNAIQAWIDPTYSQRLHIPEPGFLASMRPSTYTTIQNFILSAPGRLLARTVIDQGISLSRQLFDHEDIVLPLKIFFLLYSQIRVA